MWPFNRLMQDMEIRILKQINTSLTKQAEPQPIVSVIDYNPKDDMFCIMARRAMSSEALERIGSSLDHIINNEKQSGFVLEEGLGIVVLKGARKGKER